MNVILLRGSIVTGASDGPPIFLLRENSGSSGGVDAIATDKIRSLAPPRRFYTLFPAPLAMAISSWLQRATPTLPYKNLSFFNHAIYED